MGKRGGRAGSRFRVNGNPGRARSFRASFALAALHIHTILPQRLETELSALDLAAKKRLQGPRAYYAVHPLENYSLHPIGRQSGYCYTTPEMLTQGSRFRLAPGS
jgi:hypothetical protein